MVALTFPVVTAARIPSKIPRRVAVVLNTNARKVDDQTVRWARSVVPGRDLFLSRAVDEGFRIADRIVAEGYDAVLWGGGDGTFAAGVAELFRAADRRGAPLPEVGVLRLGTGNALADAVGAAPATEDGLAEDVLRARGVGLVDKSRSLALLDVEGRPSIFCGFGLDAQILDDFGKTVGLLRRLGIARSVESANVRYFLSVSARSVPRFLMAQRPEIVAINRGAPAIQVDVDGHAMGAPIPAGRVLWRGLASLASAATIPYYGLGMKMFPHVDRKPGRFQLRLADAGALEILTHLPAIFKGRYASPHLHDFLVDKVELVLSRPAPFQCGGDLVGERSRMTLSFWDRPISIV